MRKLLFFVLLCAASRASADSVVPETVTVRAVAWDFSWKPASEKAWRERVVGEVVAAAKDGVDVIVFPESFAKERSLDSVLNPIKDAAGSDRLVVLGNAPYRQSGWDYAVSRAYILSGGSWQVMDKLDPTPAERARKPPVRPGMRLPLFRFRGGVVAVLPAYSITKPEIGLSLKKRAVQLILVSVPEEDEAGSARVSRAASARAVEIGAAVVTAPPASVSPALYLPAQKGIDLKPQAPVGRDFRLPWRKLVELRAKPDDSTEARPYLEPQASYQVEI